ncbi:hypothetical protein, conserved [Plasmodium ovale wallikeri]|uniref:C3H1-type domain-containing protein n=1 Tax=Plasmodium ovale wallikeri TaxID=864142 RepID=A0A1A8Z2E1_PLAOA|nr:hypothetical protein, conserved [Plasmodium ovale wallikeri]SBT37927.1 hypothetical protein, conserved [Plasmodium ovale wallikeri]
MKMSVTLRQHFWKTKLCPLHMENRCKEGNNCDYAHSIEDLRSIPDLKRTKLCYKLLKGEKCFNKKCNYAHNQDELKSAQNLFAYKSSMCKFVANKTCLNGSTCRFAHSIDELRVPRIPEILLEKNNTELGGDNYVTTYVDNGIMNEALGSGNRCKGGGSNRGTNRSGIRNGNRGSNRNGNRNGNGSNITGCSIGSERGIGNGNGTGIESGNGNFSRNFDSLLNDFNAMHVKSNEQGYKNRSTNGDSNQHAYGNFAVNHRDERKRKEKNRNRNKERQQKIKNISYDHSSEKSTNKEGVMANNSVVSSSKKGENGRSKSFDSNTTISSSLNCAEEDKTNKMNEVCGSITFEKVDMNQCYGKTEESLSEGLAHKENVNGAYNRDHCSGAGDYEKCKEQSDIYCATLNGEQNDTQNGKKCATRTDAKHDVGNNNKAKAIHKNRSRKRNGTKGSIEEKSKNNSNILVNTNCVNNNEHYANVSENQYSYIDHDYDYDCNYNYNYNYGYANPLVYNKMMQMKLNAYNPYMNYKQANNNVVKNDTISNPYYPFMKQNDHVMYNHQNNMSYVLPPNYYANYLYYYTNPCNYTQFNVLEQTNNATAAAGVNCQGDLKKDAPFGEEAGEVGEEVGEEEIGEDEMGEEFGEEEIEEDEVGEEFGEEELGEDEVAEEDEVRGDYSVDVGEDDEVCRVEDGEREKKSVHVRRHGEDEKEQNEHDETTSNRKNVLSDETNYERIPMDNYFDYDVVELKREQDCREENKNTCIKNISHKNANDNIRKENGLNTNKGEQFDAEKTHPKNGNSQRKENNKQHKKKISKLVSLNNQRKNCSKGSHENYHENVNNKKRDNGNVPNSAITQNCPIGQNGLHLKHQMSPSSVYSYIHNATNAQNMNCEKKFMNPSANPMDMYLNNPYYMNQLANEQMVYNLNNRNYGYYYCPYLPPPAYNDEVYLN